MSTLPRVTTLSRLPVSLRRETLRHMYTESKGVEVLLEGADKMIQDYEDRFHGMLGSIRIRKPTLENVENYETVKALTGLLREVWTRPLREETERHTWGEVFQLCAQALNMDLSKIMEEISKKKQQIKENYGGVVSANDINTVAIENVLIFYLFAKLSSIVVKWKSEKKEREARPGILRSALMSE